MTDRFKHVQRPIMINDCDVSIKEPRDSPSLSLSSQAKQQCYGSLCFRFDSFGERFTGLVTSFFFVIFASISHFVYRWEEKGGRSKGTKERRTMTRCHVCGER